jgi:hypothetical protein
MAGWTIDEDGLVECDCGTKGFKGFQGFQVVLDKSNVVVSLECISCGEIYSVDEFKKARKVGA